jgi:hypothetical protein
VAKLSEKDFKSAKESAKTNPPLAFDRPESRSARSGRFDRVLKNSSQKRKMFLQH